MSQFVNIHTHQFTDDGSLQLINHQVQLDFPDDRHHPYSIGFHPWKIDDFDHGKVFEQLEKLADKPNVLAIGECGLDRAIETSIELQENVFTRQVELAERKNKPLIIHAVRAYPDLIRIKKTRKVNIPWILHGYNGNAQTTDQLLKHDFYFSIGPAILKQQEKHIESLAKIPTQQLFMETDDMPEKIESIYTFVARILNLSRSDLKEVIWNSYQRIFEHG